MWRRTRYDLLALLLTLVCVGLGIARPPGAAAESEVPETGEGVRLVLVLVVDQLRPDRIGPEMPGGLGRLLREGRSFSDAALAHALTATCPGHATILTGHHPGPAGIPGNRFIDRKTRKVVYCTADETEAGVLLGSRSRFDRSAGRSPRNLRVTTLGDWLKAQHAGSRVYAVSVKDRSAIMLGGQRPEAAFWLDSARSGRFTSSRYYLPELPPWTEGWSAKSLLAPLPDLWRHASGDPPNGARRDDYAAESARFSRTSPHPVKAGEDWQTSMAQLLATPYLDQRTFAFAHQLVIEEALGQRAEPDLLAVSLSATDYIGHHYGPWSQESHDALERLDAQLAEFLLFLERRVGAGRLLVVLTADHGVMSLPEWLRESGPERAVCPLPASRLSPQVFDAGLARHLAQRLGGDADDWLVRDGMALMFNPEQATARGVSLQRVVAVAARYLERQPGVARVWRPGQRDAGPEPFATLYRNSVAEGRHGDLVIQPLRGCLFTSYTSGTSHGSPYDYDRRVPLIFFGPGIDPGSVQGPAATVDIAPTLARQLAITPPPGLDGRVLSLRD